MADLSVSAPPPRPALLARLWTHQRVWLASAAILLIVALVDSAQAPVSALFAGSAIVSIAPYLAASILMAAYAGATGADGLIARAFTGSPLLMIALAAAAGGLSPFCSCGVIPLIAALLAMGVPLAAVMAFWLASPLMDPSMFALTAGTLGVEFALAKTVFAVAIGLGGGLVVHALAGAGALSDPLREGVGNGGCGGAKVRTRKEVVWAFWHDPARSAKFRTEAAKTGLFLLKWLTLAFILESLMVAYLPGDLVVRAVGGEGVTPILSAALVGVPAYLNGYAALPLVGGLLQQGMAPGAGMAFLIAGGVTSLPAAIAVWALVKKPVFALYVAISLTGAVTSGLLFQAWAG